MDYLLTGEIKSSTYDKIVDLDRVEFTDKKNKVDVLFGQAKFKSASEVDVVDKEGNQSTVTAKHIIIATGARTRELPKECIDVTTIESSEARTGARRAL